MDFFLHRPIMDFDLESLNKIVWSRYDDLSHQAIARIERIPFDKSAKLSGADSPYRTIWEEIVTQVNNGESIYWEEYKNIILAHSKAIVTKLSRTERNLLWLRTQGYDQWDEYDDSEKDVISFPDDDETVIEDIGEQISEIVYWKASQDDIVDKFTEDDEEEL